MAWSRRDFLRGLGAAGVAPVLINGCGGSTGFPPLPENLPEYEFDGTPGPETMFEHGVASGDPTTDAIVLWTRVSPETSGDSEVWVEMSLDTEFQQRVFQGTVTTNADRDYTIKIDVQDLIWGRNYYYRFFAQGRQSPIGRTRLAPLENSAQSLRIGVASCASLAHGYMHAYGHMAARGDLDVVLHLGDYIYEYENGGFGNAREYEPPTECISLQDYRMRYSQYRREPELQELHRQVPFVAVWDDHESANNSYKDGAENHDPETEGSWTDRKMASAQAYFEWLPLRDDPAKRIYRSFQYGSLVDLIMLDTRLVGRGPTGPLTIFPEDEPPIVSDQILGQEQEAWVQDQLLQSTAKWRLIGQQVFMSLWDAGEFWVWGDQWNGYPPARERFLKFLRDNGIANVVVLTGDLHSSWASDVTVGDGSYNPDTGEGAVAAEFVASGITSPGEPALISLAELGVLPNSPHIRYFEGESNGYFVLDVTAAKCQADWYHLDGVRQDQGRESLAASWAVMDGKAHVVEMDGPAPDNPSFPPLAPA